MNLKNALSPIESEMEQMSELLSAEQGEIDALIEAVMLMYQRLIVKLSDVDGITFWETEYGIIHNISLTLEERKAQVLARMNSRTSATKEILENLVKQVISADSVEIVEYPEEYRFEIYVGTDCFEEHMNIAEIAVDEARPAHLVYKFINSIYRKYKCDFYVGAVGSLKKSVTGLVNTEGLNIDKYRCGFFWGIVSVTKKIEEERVDTSGLYINE